MGVVVLLYQHYYCVVFITECHNSHKHSQSASRNYKYEQGWKLGKFFSYVCNGKKIKELFASTLNGIPISVIHVCVFSMIGVINAKLTRLLVAHAYTESGEK